MYKMLDESVKRKYKRDFDVKKFSEDHIDMKKEYSRFKKQVFNKTRNSNCLICGEKLHEGDCCKSHSIPRFVLKEIAVDGMILSVTAFNDDVIFEPEVFGIENAGTFMRICKKCDNEYFQEYENADALLSEKVEQKVLRKIAAKSMLAFLDSHIFERQVMETIKAEIDDPIIRLTYFVKNADYNEDKRDLEDLLNEELKINFRVIYHKVLDYVVPMACHIPVCLTYDLKGQRMYNDYDTYCIDKVELIYVAVLPVNGKTVVLIFMDDKNERYEGFIQQFNAESEKNKLAIINYIIFLTSDQVLLHIGLKNLCKNKNFKQVCCSYGTEILEHMEDSYMNISRRINIPNLLMKKIKK